MFINDVLDRHLAFFREAQNDGNPPFLMGPTCTYGNLVDTLANRGRSRNKSPFKLGTA